jgi:hypothetical protein
MPEVVHRCTHTSIVCVHGSTTSTARQSRAEATHAGALYMLYLEGGEAEQMLIEIKGIHIL